MDINVDELETSLKGNHSGESAGALWSPKAVFWVGLLCSAVLAGVMQAINFGRLKRPDTKRNIILLTIAGGFAFFFFLPDEPPFNNDLIILAFNGIISYGISLMHAHAYARHRAAGGQAIPIRKTILFSFVGFIFLLVVIFGTVYLSELISEPQ